ncbi:MAG: molybdenum cofactor synthesis domain-containing protein [Candidatus Omnitrophota bacterium]
MGKILAVCISRRKGVSKKNIKKSTLKIEHGLVNDAHAGPGKRQVSLLAKESLDILRRDGIKIGCGGFGENITTSGIELTTLAVGVELCAGNAILEVTEIGKKCKRPCKIYKDKGMCILPSQGIFAKVVKGGIIKQDDTIKIIRRGNILSGILIVSDRSHSGVRKDESGQRITEILKDINAESVRYKVVPDDFKIISDALRDWSEREELDLIITSGGTGFSPRDITPEATRAIIQKEAPGLSEMMRVKSAKKTGRSFLSRGVSGIRKKSLIINLPGSPKAVSECLRIILPLLGHAVEVMRGEVKDCRRQGRQIDF